MKKAALTGTKHFTDKLYEALSESGICACKYPYVEIGCTDAPECAPVLENIEQYNWIMFTSANAITCFFKMLDELKISMERLENTRFAAVGQSTADVLLEYGCRADFIPSSFYGEVLGSEFAIKYKADRDNIKVLIPHAQNAGAKLTKCLDEAGFFYVDLPVYKTEVSDKIRDKLIFDLPEFDIVTFASAMGVKFLFEGMENKKIKAALSGKAVFCIGKETARALDDIKITEYKMAKSADAAGLAALVLNK